MSDQATQLSVVVPAYEEAPNLRGLYGEIKQAVDPLGLAWEAIFVDDGSQDETFAVLRELHGEEKGRVRVIRFRRNFGKAAALAAGFAAARGEVVITMDGDGQDDPAEIPRFLEALGQGWELVSGWKQRRQDPRSKVWLSRIFNWVVAVATGLRLHDINCGFKAYRAQVTRELRPYGELHRYLAVMAHARGYRVTEIPVAHRPRQAGRSKYGWERLVRGYLDLHTVLLLTRYGDRPLHFFGPAGLALFAMGLVSGSALAIWWRAWLPVMLAALMVICGVQLVCIGLVAELLVSREGERPHYSIAERLE